MNFINKCMSKWEEIRHKIQPFIDKVKYVFDLIYDKVSFVWDYILQYKKLFLAAPVAAMAVILAIQNLFKLPALVGFIQQANGDFEVGIIREVAVLGPLVITALCLLLMFASKRTLTPWLVSVFSLILPLLILITNTFPG